MSDRLLRESDVIEAVTQYISCDYSTEEMARKDTGLLIGQIPSADRPRGKWIGDKCSVCGNERAWYGCNPPFCPDCGADMRDEDDE